MSEDDGCGYGGKGGSLGYSSSNKNVKQLLFNFYNGKIVELIS